jgi:Tol biopolymer transport system component/DNA-binding winged helix-turn-helix (wHTH) protein
MAEPSKTLGSIRFGRFDLSVETGELRKDGIRLKLAGQAIDVLLLLATNPGKLVSREDLQQKLWPGASYGDPEHGLNAAVNKLRETLGDSATEPKYIETVPGRGYRFIATLDSPVVPPEPRPTEPESARESPRTPWWKRKATIAVASFLVAVGLLYPLVAPYIERLLRQNELRQLTVVPLTALPGYVWSPTFSPDGSQIAFLWYDNTHPKDGGLYVKVIGNDRPVRLAPDVSRAAWSPDGKNIAICRGFGDVNTAISLISPLGGTERKITSIGCSTMYRGSNLSWSPDGKQLAFLSYGGEGFTRLFVVSLDTLEPTQVKTDCKAAMLPAFSPRGDYLAWACADKQNSVPVYLTHLSDGRVTELVRSAEGFEGLVWSQDGRRIVFSSGGDLWEVALSRPNRPEKLPFGHDASDLAVSFTGHRLAYQQTHENANIWRLDLSQPQAPAEKVVASSRYQTAPDYSPDGTKITFMSNRSGNFEIWVSDSDGSNPLQLSSFGTKDTGTPRWSPDGKLIAFDSRVGSDVASIYLVDPRGGVPHKLDIDVRGTNVPSWSHDGKWIYFVTGQDSKIWKVPSTGGHAVQITQHLGGMPNESPDGKYVYFSSLEGQLWRVAIDGPGEQPVQGMPQMRDAWSLFGSGIYFLGDANGKTGVDFFDLNTKKARKILVLDKIPAGWMPGFPVSPDGRWLLFAQTDEISSDLMMVENWR